MKNEGTTIKKNKEARHYQIKVKSTEIKNLLRKAKTICLVFFMYKQG